MNRLDRSHFHLRPELGQEQSLRRAIRSDFAEVHVFLQPQVLDHLGYRPASRLFPEPPLLSGQASGRLRDQVASAVQPSNQSGSLGLGPDAAFSAQLPRPPSARSAAHSALTDPITSTPAAQDACLLREIEGHQEQQASVDHEGDDQQRCQRPGSQQRRQASTGVDVAECCVGVGEHDQHGQELGQVIEFGHEARWPAS